MRDGIVKEDFGRGTQAFRRLRDVTSDEICDTAAGGTQDDFRFSSAIIPLDKALLIEARMGSVRNDRTPRHIARSGMDHYQVTLCLTGQQTVAVGRRSIAVRPGDLYLTDMAQASRIELVAHDVTKLSRGLTLVLPRTVLARLLGSPDAASGALVSRDGPQGRLLGEQFLALYRQGTQQGTKQGTRQNGQDGINSAQPATTDDLAGVIAAALGNARDADAAIDRANRHMLLAAIKRHISANLQTPTLGAEQLCTRFQLSRATLYRLFEPEGGLWRYIQDQRLQSAFASLVSSASSHIRMIDLAMDFRFSSDSTFVRAFRQRFGLTPGEVKQIAATGAAFGHGNDADMPDSLLRLRTLGRGA